MTMKLKSLLQLQELSANATEYRLVVDQTKKKKKSHDFQHKTSNTTFTVWTYNSISQVC